MRNKILVVFMVIALWTAGQVPNTTTFSLQDVLNVVNPPMQAAVPTDKYDLQDCFAAAISSYFDPAYSGSKNSLLNFRNYGNCYSYISSGSLTSMANTNSLSVPYPAVNANDIVFVIAGHYSASTMTITGWLSTTTSYLGYRLTLFYKHFTSSDAGGTLYITSTDYATKFATVHRIKGKASFTISQKNALLNQPTTTYTPNETITGDACEMALAFPALFISQALNITQGSGWTVRQNVWQSSVGALAILSYNFTSTMNAPSNTYGFTGQVPFGYISVLLE